MIEKYQTLAKPNSATVERDDHDNSDYDDTNEVVYDFAVDKNDDSVGRGSKNESRSDTEDGKLSLDTDMMGNVIGGKERWMMDL